MGLNVITTGNEPGLIGNKYSHRYIKEDFANKDLILRIAKKIKLILYVLQHIIKEL